MEEIDLYLEEAQELMEKAVLHTRQELSKVRAGKAMPNMLDDIRVDYYGAPTPLNQVSSVTTPDARTLAIKPFDKNTLGLIVNAIRNSDLGLNPINDGDLVRINIPPLTEERRRDLLRQVKNDIENGKISIRSIRKDTNDSLRKLQKEGAPEDAVKRGEDRVQQLTDKYVSTIDEVYAQKEKEIMTV
ncbi:ribosome recycling factor [Catalinimonas alkaloidigena]|uniref:Ribosome-recycling factor n=1 Tax=Catalinimonas alkaloidigena TaxID=1075417 RepID=A0A1G9Q9C9_9BACT|nr:ribosome recycling factor [Catalinimonas alkaloidigena]SDM07682.1 ribosome recycling factor [Catalinimonas alkaloidigena]